MYDSGAVKNIAKMNSSTSANAVQVWLPDQPRQRDTGHDAQHRAQQPPVALDQDLAGGRGVEEHDPAGQHRPVPALAGEELAADDGQRRPHRDLNGGPGGGPPQSRALVLLRRPPRAASIATSSASNSSRERVVAGVSSDSSCGPSERDPQPQHRAGGLADAAEDVLDGGRGARQVLLVAVAEQPVAHMGQRRAPVRRTRAAATSRRSASRSRRRVAVASSAAPGDAGRPAGRARPADAGSGCPPARRCGR